MSAGDVFVGGCGDSVSIPLDEPAPTAGARAGPTEAPEPCSAVAGSPEQIADALLGFHELGFDEVHCYGPAPSQEGGRGWDMILDRLRAGV